MFLVLAGPPCCNPAAYLIVKGSDSHYILVWTDTAPLFLNVYVAAHQNTDGGLTRSDLPIRKPSLMEQAN